MEEPGSERTDLPRATQWGKCYCLAVGPGHHCDPHHFQGLCGSRGGAVLPSWPSSLDSIYPNPPHPSPLLIFSSHTRCSYSPPCLLSAGCSLHDFPSLALPPHMSWGNLKLPALDQAPSLFTTSCFCPCSFFCRVSSSHLPSLDKHVLISSLLESLF